MALQIVLMFVLPMASYKNEIKQLNPEIKDKVQFIFITVDAHRDTSEVLKEYVSSQKISKLTQQLSKI